MHKNVLVYLLLFVHSYSHLLINNQNDSSDWTYFMFVQRWPQATCQIVNASGHPCFVPAQVKGWTIHGLWPSGVKSYPEYCRNWTFDMNQVMDLKENLLRLWPNLYIKETEDSLWKHEYEKHGTCAANTPGFEKEHDYFQRTLELQEKYNIQRVMENNKVFPQPKGFDATFISNTMRKLTNYTTCPGCGYVEGVGQVLSQHYVCLNKHLELIDCPQCERPCNSSHPVLYQPLHFY